MTGLVADIGSTNARFALVTGARDGRPVLSQTAVFPCREFHSLEAVMYRFLETIDPAQRPRAATIAVAAPTTEDTITLTNNRWQFSVSGLKRDLKFDRFSVINDFTAISLSLLKLPPQSMHRIGPEADLTTARAVGAIGPGSGLGIGALIEVDGRQVPLPSEGGHVAFAPQTEREWAIARRLAARYGHVSNERLLSGPGLANILGALCDIAGVKAPTAIPAEILARGLGGEDAQCRETLEVFCGILGGAAGDLSLMLYADAVFIGGGIVPRFIDFLESSTFRKRFEAKGRFADYLAKVPTIVVTEKYAGLIGAAAHLLQHQAA